MNNYSEDIAVYVVTKPTELGDEINISKIQLRFLEYQERLKDCHYVMIWYSLKNVC